jgi:DNA-binding response OmpR family regulator
MQKPFRDEAELIARIRTRLRRTNSDVTGLLTIGDLTIDVTAHEVRRGSVKITLTRLEFDLLHVMPFLVRSGDIGIQPIQDWSMCTCRDFVQK